MLDSAISLLLKFQAELTDAASELTLTRWRYSVLQKAKPGWSTKDLLKVGGGDLCNDLGAVICFDLFWFGLVWF